MSDDDPGDLAVAVRLSLIGGAMALLGVLVVQLPTPWSALGEVRSEPTAPMQSDRTEPDVPEGWAPGSGARVVVPPDRQWTGT